MSRRQRQRPLPAWMARLFETPEFQARLYRREAEAVTLVDAAWRFCHFRLETERK